jgi:hypothetical protein
METIHVGFDELQVKIFSKNMILRKFLMDIPERMDDEKSTVVLNGTARKEEFMSFLVISVRTRVKVGVHVHKKEY